MLAKYVYKPSTSNVGEIFADIKAILTGETLVSNLSASCLQGSSYIVSAEPAGWEELTTGLHDVYDSGNLNVLGVVNSATHTGSKWIAVSSNGIANSTDGKNWTLRSSVTGFVAVAYSVASGLSIAVKIASTTATVYYSSDNGDTWTAGGTYTVTAGSNLFDIGVFGSTFYMVNPNGATANVYTTTNGTTVSTVATGFSNTYKIAVSNGTSILLFGTGATCVSSTDGASWVSNTCYSSPNGVIYNGSVFISCSTSGSIIQSSPDGLVWTTVGSGNFKKLAYYGGAVIATSPTTGLFYENLNDGATWISRPSPTLVSPYAIASTTAGTTLGGFLTFGTNASYKIGASKLNAVFRAPLVGGEYKFVFLEVRYTENPVKILLTVYEHYNTSSKALTNVAYSSDNSTYAQQLDTAGGGLVFIGANVRYMVLFSYITNLNVWGGTMGSCAVGCFEATRDDPWNVPGTPLVAYPCWYFVGNSTFNCYSPRYKSKPGVDLISASNYQYSLRTLSLSATQALDENDVGYYISQDVAISALSVQTGNYVSRGGSILGGLKMANIGATGDEMLIGADYYVILNVGATTRWLLPKV
ncbi:MAG: hypothetical protein PHR16_11715 [Methylovulum sp.]|nr:hypothetical protein [Methylovulum sp.]